MAEEKVFLGQIFSKSFSKSRKTAQVVVHAVRRDGKRTTKTVHLVQVAGLRYKDKSGMEYVL